MDKATALVVRTYDFSETSRIAILWTREFGKVRALAKGAKRLKSNFDSALDLLTVCAIVLIRKSTGGLDLLTEAQTLERFAPLRHDLSALYGGYYVAELLGDWAPDHDPHPELFDEALRTLRDLGQPGYASGPRIMRFELVLMRELGYGLALKACVACGAERQERAWILSAAGGGTMCPKCQAGAPDRRAVSATGWAWLAALDEEPEAWKRLVDPAVRGELRSVLGEIITYQMGRRPRLHAFVGS